MAISLEMADKLLRSRLTWYENVVTKLLNIVVDQNQFDALVDFTYEMGVKALLGSRLLEMVNAGNYIEAACEIEKMK